MTLGRLEATPSPSRADAAYEAVRDLLVTLAIPPGAPISESELMDRLGVGRTPLREAMHRLESERLVNIYPRRGTFAADINLADLALITDLRHELEGHAAQRAAERATPQDRARLRRLLDQIDDRSGQIELDTEIHRAVYQAAHNHFLTDTATRFHNLALRIWHLFIDRLPDLDQHIAEHRALLGSIIDGDAARAREVAERHVRSFERAVRTLL